LLHFVANAPWSDAAVLAKVRELILPVIERSPACSAVDDN
jgi:SRSO17 transposase